MSKITVVTYTYNRPHYLKRAVESVLNQTFEDFEYLIINNGSTDPETDRILSSFAREDSRVFFCSYKDNSLVSGGNRFEDILHNVAKGSSSSEYFFNMDDDDFMDKDTFRELYNMATETGSGIVGVGSRFAYPDGSFKDKYVYEGTFTFNRIEGMKELLKREKFNSARGGKLYKKTVLDFEFPKNVRMRDIYREYRVMNNISGITVCGKPMYYFYRHDDNLSGLETAESITPEKMKEHLHANSVRTQWLTKNMPEIKDFVHYCEASFMISLWERIYRLNVSDCFNIAEVMKNRLSDNKECLSGYDYFTDREKNILTQMQINLF